MKAIIQKLIEEISALPVPKDPAQVQKKFEMFPELTTITPTNEIEEACVQQLMVVQKFADAGNKLNRKISDLKLHEEEFVQYQTQESVLSKELQEINAQISQSREREMYYRQEITTKFEQFLLSIEQEVPHQLKGLTPSPDVTRVQAKLVNAIQTRINGEIFRRELPTKKLRLLELKETRASLLSQFYNLAEFHGLGLSKSVSENATEFTALRTSLDKELQQCLALRPQFEELQKQFAECISTTDAQEKSKELLLRKTNVAKKIDHTAQEIERHPIAKELRGRLLEEFKQSPNKEELIKAYSSKVSLIHSALDSILYYDPTSVLKRAFTITGYKPQQDETSLSIQFLTLLNQQKEQQDEEDNLSAQLDALAKISNSAEYNEKQESKLIERTRGLVNALPKCKIPIAFSAEASTADYYLLLMDNMIFLPQKIKYYEALIIFLDKLLPIMNELEQLRKETKLHEDQDNLLLSIEELRKDIPAGIEEELAKNREHLSKCNAFIAEFRKIVEQLNLEQNKQKQIDQQKDDITFKLIVLQKALAKKLELQNEKSFAKQIEELSLELSALQHALVTKLDSIKSGSEQVQVVTTTTIATGGNVDKGLSSGETNNGDNGLLSGKKEDDEQALTQSTVLASTVDSTQGTNKVHEAGLASTVSVLVDSVGTLATTGASGKKEDIQLTTEVVTGGSSAVIKLEKQDQHELTHSTQAIHEVITDLISQVEKGESDADHGQKKGEGSLSAVDTTQQETTSSGLALTTKDQEKEEAVQGVLDSDKGKKSDEVVAGIEGATSTSTSKVIVDDSNKGSQSISLPDKKEDINKIHIASSHYHIISSVTEPPIQNNSELEQLRRWHQQIDSIVNQHSEQLRDWYLELYKTAEAAAEKTPYNYKYSHLIRDVTFALSHGLGTIDYYKRICPNPKENCDALLALKPNVPIYDSESFDEQDMTLLPKQFQELYKHHKVLKANPRYAVESELLMQAMSSLLFVYKTKEHIPTEEIPHINHDPRYEPLKRHRGFLRVWELIEDLCRLIVGKLSGRAEHEYRNRPCFFKTHSLQLLEKAELLITEKPAITSPVAAGG